MLVDSDSNAPTLSTASSDNSRMFRYRYVVHRAGSFHRFEQPSDAADIDADADLEDRDVPISMDREGNQARASSASSSMETSERSLSSSSSLGTDPVQFHKLPLRLLADRESYVVSDVLGKTSGPPSIEHNRYDHFRTNSDVDERNATSVDNMHSRSSSFSSKGTSFPSMGAPAKKKSPGPSASRKKTVGFAPAPPPYHRPKSHNQTSQAVSLNSTDGLVVVSVFLPVVLHRSDEGHWTADWDYEALLSMQTPLRVTRIGVVKWRGWHGNTGSHGSPEAGVPFNERHLVEECLRPFNCVPVWINTTLFGEM